jgi:hypothetical protein
MKLLRTFAARKRDSGKVLNNSEVVHKKYKKYILEITKRFIPLQPAKEVAGKF